ncbi:MAG: hypothetical protein R2705_22935 [Ilumatobacteraceae bacterium]
MAFELLLEQLAQLSLELSLSAQIVSPTDALVALADASGDDSPFRAESRIDAAACTPARRLGAGVRGRRPGVAPCGTERLFRTGRARTRPSDRRPFPQNPRVSRDRRGARGSARLGRATFDSTCAP